VDLCSAVVADEEPAALVQPGEGAFNDPAFAAEPGAVSCPAAGDHGLDAARPQLSAIALVVVAAVGDEPIGSSPRPSDAAAHCRDGVEQRQQLGDVVAVAAGECPGQRQAAPIG
jgi:hypothetical protein